MRSSQVAAEAGVNVQTLRYYERRGLLAEPERSGSGYRSYDTQAVRTVRFVKSAQQLGFSLDEIDSLLDLAAGGPDNCAAAKAVATQRLVQLEEKIASLNAMRDSLRQLVATCKRTPSRRICPLLEAIEDDIDKEGTMSEHAGCSDAAFISSVEGFESFPHLVRLIARGRPVELTEIAGIAQRPDAEVEQALRAQPGTDWDDEGRLVGFGLTLVPTEHRYIVGGRTLYTWCATDTLLFTLILGVAAVAESTCPATGQPIRVELCPDAVISLEPRDAVISERHLGAEVADLRSEVCEEGHFYASRAAAQSWAGEHPEGEVLSVTDAFDRCRQACEELDWLNIEGART